MILLKVSNFIPFRFQYIKKYIKFDTTIFVDTKLLHMYQRKNQLTQRNNKPNKQFPTNNVHIADARNKIILKKRTQITDAREKLAELAKQKDARLKLEKLRQNRQARTVPFERNVLYSHGNLQRIVPNKGHKDREIRDRVFADRSRQVVSQPLALSKIPARHQMQTKRFIANQTFKPRIKDNMARPKPIVRTVENDIEIIDDPMGEEYTPEKPNSFNRKASLQLKIVAHNKDAQNSRSINIHRTATIEKEKSPPRPPSILKKRPMAALATDKKTPKTDKSAFEYRIIVSNLRNTVTASDIEELFGDVGGMVESRLVRPGTAEVIYKTQEDAQRAVDLYHNRQLDGQPMNCLLVAPRSSTGTSRSGTVPALYSTNSNVEPDISTFHKVLFSNM
ncbi:hypothetical protein K1T71_003976 [Dendrolimus kikuchii]|uniref:Uncharacterized protein n=1 Tax=Dendrolimus kikuchii TaxID=765133 RepID=A0ACC1D9N3_9NEOP|nr:hypothetical protein K1T71_003976 [Dendrolimus kikuchii]